MDTASHVNWRLPSWQADAASQNRRFWQVECILLIGLGVFIQSKASMKTRLPHHVAILERWTAYHKSKRIVE